MLAAAEQKYTKDYAAALRADWTESDLRGFGIDAPSKKAGGRPRNSKSRRPAPAQPASVSADDGAAG